MPTEEFPGRYESLSPIRDFVYKQALEAGLDESQAYAVQSAVDEACSNIIDHAYGGEDRGTIFVTCTDGKKGLTITIRDFGKPFDPTKVHKPRPIKNLKDIQTGGLGLHFIRNFMDEVHFDFSIDQGNLLTLTKYRGEST